MIIFKYKKDLYPGFKKGTPTDSDVITRCCGYFDDGVNHVCSVSANFGENTYEVKFFSSGEQRISNYLDEEVEDRFSNTLSNARK
jgi:hypothetical protein